MVGDSYDLKKSSASGPTASRPPATEALPISSLNSLGIGKVGQRRFWYCYGG
jgi:hypothetical protein